MAELARRQDNIDPIRRIPNGALFQGTLINGTRHLNKLQRIGAVIVGLFSLASGCFSMARIFAELRSWSPGYDALSFGIFGPFSLWVGWKITINAIVNQPKNRLPRKD
jgi:hypothetical protein